MTERELLEKAEIKEAIDQIAFFTDSNHLEKVLEIFSEDAEYSILKKGEVLQSVKGKAALRESLNRMEEKYSFLFHLIGTKIVEVQSMTETALSNSCCVVRQGLKGNAEVQTQYVEYGDKWIKVNGNWYLVSRTVNILSQNDSEQA